MCFVGFVSRARGNVKRFVLIIITKRRNNEPTSKKKIKNKIKSRN